MTKQQRFDRILEILGLAKGSELASALGLTRKSSSYCRQNGVPESRLGDRMRLARERGRDPIEMLELVSDGRRGGEGIGATEAREAAYLGNELGGEHGPHAGQAADEGRIRVTAEEVLQLAVEAGETGPGGERTLGQGLDLGQAAGGLEVADEALFAGGPQLGRGNEPGQQHERPPGGQIDGPLQAWENADQEIVQSGEPLGLCSDQIATSADQQAQLEVELTGRLDRAQVPTDVHLLGDHARVTEVGLLLAADGCPGGRS
jgi:hypothetical protein